MLRRLDRHRLRDLFDSPDSRAGRTLDFVIQGLILVSMICFCLETVDSVASRYGRLLYVIEVAIVSVFAAEYVLRIIAAERKLAFIFSFYGIVDLLAIAPFFLVPTADLRAARVVRVFRLFRVMKLFRYSRALDRFHRAIVDTKEEFSVFFLTAGLVIFLASVGIYHFEHEAQPDKFGSVFHAMWWAVVTLTTVGYGDVYPITTGGKIFTSVLLICGLAIVAVPSGTLASALTRDSERL